SMPNAKTWSRSWQRRACASMVFTSTNREPMIGTKEIDRPKIFVTAVPMGITAGLLAVLAGAIFDVRPPEAYGICMACHARDLVNWTLNGVVRTHLDVAPASLFFPVLTPIGVLIGALIASKTSGEFRWQKPDNSVKAFLYGIFVM